MQTINRLVKINLKTIASICFFIYNTFDNLNSKEKRSNYGRTRFKPNDFIVLA